jgi:lipoate-protein ligase B
LTGVWVQPDVWSRCTRCRPEHRGRPAKVASIGIKVDVNGVSRHGFAINVNPDMGFWDGIVGCGLPGQPMAALADLRAPVPPMAEVKRAVVESLRELLS